MTDVVSLLPSVTEILYKIEKEPIGVSGECDFPSEANNKPRITKSKINTDKSSKDINKQVGNLKKGKNNLYEIDRDLLQYLDPDVVITQGICDVCAVDKALIKEVISNFDLGTEIVTVDSRAIHSILENIILIGKKVDRKERAEKLVNNLEKRMKKIKNEVENKKQNQVNVVVLDWMDPPMVAGHWMPELVTYAGGRYGLVESGGYSIPIDWNRILNYDPDILIVSPCGFSIEKIISNISDLKRKSDWKNISAVKKIKYIL